MESNTFTPATSVSSITFKSLAEIASKRVQVVEAGQEYTLKVTNATPYTRADGTATVILNFNAMTGYNVAQFNAAIKSNDIVLAQKQVVTASQRVGKDFVPNKGQLVKVIFDWIPVKGSEEVALRPISVSALPQAVAKAGINFDLEAAAACDI